MTLSLKRLVPVTAVTAAAAAAVLIPAAGASAAPAPFAVPSLPALPVSAAGLPPLPAFNLPAFAAVPLTFQGPQVAIGPTVIGSVFNGGTSVVVANDPPVNSGNVIGSP